MFYYISGILKLKTADTAVLDVGGVGYSMHTTYTTLSKLTIDEKCTLYTYLHVREDIFELFGFYTQEELNCFKLLLGISGVGPKAAIAILSILTPEKLSMCVLTGDEKIISQAQGVGKKLAQRIILELKDKLSKASEDDIKAAGKALMSGERTALNEAISALQALGYSPSEAAFALKPYENENLTVSELVKSGLKAMSAQKK